MGLFKPYWMKKYIDSKKAAGKLDRENQDMLKQIALEAPSDNVVNEAIKRIEDQAFIKKYILDETKETYLRRNALMCLKDPKDILDCVFESENDYIRDTAEEMIADKLSKKDRVNHMIRRLREAGDSFSFPNQYVEYLTDPSDLLKIIQYDKNGKTLKAAKGYKFVDAKKNDVPITSSFDSFGPNAAYYLALSGASPDKRLTTTVTSSDGYYSIYIVKK